MTFPMTSEYRLQFVASSYERGMPETTPMAKDTAEIFVQNRTPSGLPGLLFGARGVWPEPPGEPARWLLRERLGYPCGDERKLVFCRVFAHTLAGP